MTKVMEGVRVLEVAQYTFVPAAGAVLADWGADVIKIEHPTRGDAQRGFIRVGALPITAARNTVMEHPNRGKRSVGVDVGKAYAAAKDKVKVAFIGMTLQATPSIVTPTGVAGLSFKDVDGYATSGVGPIGVLSMCHHLNLKPDWIDSTVDLPSTLRGTCAAVARDTTIIVPNEYLRREYVDRYAGKVDLTVINNPWLSEPAAPREAPRETRIAPGQPPHEVRT